MVFMSFRTNVRNLYLSAIRFLPMVEVRELVILRMTATCKILRDLLLNFRGNQVKISEKSELMMFSSFIQGVGVGGGLIVAIGAQNAFVLSQGIQGNHHLVVALTCILCDVVFISAGIAGIGTTIATHPSLVHWATMGGAGYLFVYGLLSLRSAIRGGSLDTNERAVRSQGGAIGATLAVTLLNPHFYLDTVILLGGISSGFHEENRLLFWTGAVSASIIWFSCLSFGGRLLAPVFRMRLSWRILDSFVCLTMWSVALSIVLPVISIE